LTEKETEDAGESTSVIPSHVEETNYNTARELFDALVFDAPDGLLFRGVEDAEFDLRPKIARDDVLSRLEAKFSDGKFPERPWKDRLAAQLESYEQFLMSTYYQAVSQAGGQLPTLEEAAHTQLCGVPGVSLFSRFSAEAKSSQLESHPAYWPLLAKMQHVGIETRLLDWSRSAVRALFFAASGAVRIHDRKASSHIAVWELNPEFTGWCAKLSCASWETPLPGVGEEMAYATRLPAEFDVAIHVYAPNQSGNANMQAQHGVFTVLGVAPFSKGYNRNRGLLDDVWGANNRYDLRYAYSRLAECHAALPKYRQTPEFVPLKKHVLPAQEQQSLLTLLGKIGVTRPAMFVDGGAFRPVIEPQIDDWFEV
jgi:hypothetical protein